MFIRQTKTRSKASGQEYFTYRLVESKRVGSKVNQKTILNLGTNFDTPKDQWVELCIRLEQILQGDQALFDSSPRLENTAQNIYAQIIAKRGKDTTKIQEEQFAQVDIASLQQIKPRSVGAEHASLEALNQLDLPEILQEAGFSQRQTKEALANIIGRMCAPRSERATAEWLKSKSALGELLDYNFSAMPLMQLYRASDRLLGKKSMIEDKLFSRVQDLFQLSSTITLYDLTNTYMEGEAMAKNPKAKRGRSKEKRSDSPLITLGAALDSSGFLKRTEIFEGNVSEGSTLPKILEQLQASKNATVIMDAGIASEENLQWLLENNYNYLVVSRERKRSINKEKAITIQSAGNHNIHLQRQAGSHEEEIKIACWSEQREAKEKGIIGTKKTAFESSLNNIKEGLQKPRTTKKQGALNQRIGRLKEKYKTVSAHYDIDLVLDESNAIVTELHWKYQPKQESKATDPGVYTLRTTHQDWGDEEIWRTYTMLTDLESVFRSLKSDLGMRPIYHRLEDRCDGHIFITVLAYQAVQVIRRQLKEYGINSSWNSLREILNQQQRITATFKQRDAKTLHIRQATKPEEELSQIYKALNISSSPGGLQKVVN